jgi:hypothetical protein
LNPFCPMQITRTVVSNHILSVATNVATKALLSPLCIINCKIREKYEISLIKNLFLNNCLLPHIKLLSPNVANGDKVGHHRTRSYPQLFSCMLFACRISVNLMAKKLPMER